MNYPPNTTRWPVGALVIHDADAKRAEMLMRVVGYDKASGKCKTQYAYPSLVPQQWRRKVWRNDIAALHDPALFFDIGQDKGAKHERTR
jgi:hypothetical protein